MAAVRAAKAEREVAPAEAVADEAPISRPEMRAPLREEDPRTRAARRAAEIMEHLGGDMDDGTDEFYVSPNDIPTGWSYEWKTKSVLGLENPAEMVQLARTGWEAVPAARHPAYMPAGSKDATIERKGMILMERPMEITEQARQIELRKARNQVRQKEAQLSAAPEGQFGRQKSDGSGLVKISKSYEPISIPSE